MHPYAYKMLDNVDRSCLTWTDQAKPNEHISIKVPDKARPVVRIFRSSAAARHAVWIDTDTHAHLCRCMAAALRDALNDMLQEPVHEHLACERFTEELKHKLLHFYDTMPGLTGEEADAWFESADQRKDDLFAAHGMLTDERQ